MPTHIVQVFFFDTGLYAKRPAIQLRKISGDLQECYKLWEIIYLRMFKNIFTIESGLIMTRKYLCMKNNNQKNMYILWWFSHINMPNISTILYINRDYVVSFKFV